MTQASRQKGINKLFTEEGYRTDAKQAFLRHTKETGQLDVLQRCKRLNDFLSQGFLTASDDPAGQLQGILDILNSGPKRPACLDKPPITKRKQKAVPKEDNVGKDGSTNTEVNVSSSNDSGLNCSEADNILNILDEAGQPKSKSVDERQDRSKVYEENLDEVIDLLNNSDDLATKERESELERENAALCIQNLWRGVTARKSLYALRAERRLEVAAVHVQKAARAYQARKLFAAMLDERNQQRQLEEERVIERRSSSAPCLSIAHSDFLNCASIQSIHIPSLASNSIDPEPQPINSCSEELPSCSSLNQNPAPSLTPLEVSCIHLLSLSEDALPSCSSVPVTPGSSQNEIMPSPPLPASSPSNPKTRRHTTATCPTPPKAPQAKGPIPPGPGRGSTGRPPSSNLSGMSSPSSGQGSPQLGALKSPPKAPSTASSLDASMFSTGPLVVRSRTDGRLAPATTSEEHALDGPSKHRAVVDMVARAGVTAEMEKLAHSSLNARTIMVGSEHRGGDEALAVVKKGPGKINGRGSR